MPLNYMLHNIFIYVYIYKLHKTRHSLICTWDHNDSCYSKLGPCMNTFKWHTQKVTTRVFSLHISLAINVLDIFHGTQVLEQGSQYHRLCMGRGHSPARHIVGTGAHHLWPHLSFTCNAHPLCFVLKNFLKLITEVRILHIKSLCEQ